MNLPKYNKPPVVEVALSVQFQRPAGLTVAHLGIAWQEFRSRFPTVEQHEPLPHIVERRGLRGIRPKMQLAFASTQDEMPRVWMISSDNHQLLQFQADRFIRNWRKYHNPSAAYPSWDKLIRPDFVSDFKQFGEFLQAQGLGELLVEQCEVTYVNHIMPNEIWQKHTEIGKVFRTWSTNFPELPNTDDGGCSTRSWHELVDSEGNFLGRLHIDMDSVYLIASSEPIFNFQLIVRGQPKGQSLDDVLHFMDFGHETIVNSFTALTTQEMHKIWERTQ